MRNQPRSYRVVLMDDDHMASQFIAYLVARDLSLELSAETHHPDQLIRQVSQVTPDLILLDPEYRAPIPLRELIVRLTAIAPRAPIVCLSQYGDEETVSQAVQSGVRGFLLKDEVQLALAHVILRSLEYDFIYSSGVERYLFLQRLALPARRRTFRPWRPNPHLSERHLKAIWLTVIYGMSARMAAYEAGLSENTIHTYIRDTRSILITELVEAESELMLGDKRIPSDDQTYLLFTRVEEE